MHSLLALAALITCNTTSVGAQAPAVIDPWRFTTPPTLPAPPPVDEMPLPDGPRIGTPGQFEEPTMPVNPLTTTVQPGKGPSRLPPVYPKGIRG
jgi:hypothetical protein